MIDEPTVYDGGLQHIYGDGPQGYDVPTLWTLSEKCPRFELSVVRWHWFLSKTAWSDCSVLESGGDGEHWDRILEADMNHPILMRFKDNELIMVDGYHRLARAYLEDRRSIAAIDVSDVMNQALVDPAFFGRPEEARWNRSGHALTA